MATRPMWIVKCFAKNGGLIWEEKTCTRDGARRMVAFCKNPNLRFTIEKAKI